MKLPPAAALTLSVPLAVLSAGQARADDPPKNNDPAFDFKKNDEAEVPAPPAPPQSAAPAPSPSPSPAPALPIDDTPGPSKSAESPSPSPSPAPAPQAPPAAAPAPTPAPSPKAAAPAKIAAKKAAKPKKRGAKKIESIPPGSPIAGVPAFRVLDDGSSRIFLKITGKPSISERRAPGQLGIVLPGVYIPSRIEQLPLDTSFFATPVSKVRLMGDGGNAMLSIEMKRPAEPTVKVENQSDGIVILIDFPKPSP